jgi:hypothetical protein
VEHAYALSRSRWRTATLVAAAVAALELVVLGAIGFKALARTVSHDVQAAAVAKVAGPPPVRTHTPAGRVTLPRDETGVLVLNGNGVSGAAAAGAERVRARGYLVAGVGNANTQASTRTLVMYRGAFRPEAVRLAHDVHASVVAPLDGLKPSELMGAQLVLVLGS